VGVSGFTIASVPGQTPGSQEEYSGLYLALVVFAFFDRRLLLLRLLFFAFFDRRLLLLRLLFLLLLLLRGRLERGLLLDCGWGRGSWLGFLDVLALIRWNWYLVHRPGQGIDGPAEQGEEQE
jgi:hypothetical protein